MSRATLAPQRDEPLEALASIRLGGKVLITADALERRLAATMQKAGQ